MLPERQAAVFAAIIVHLFAILLLTLILPGVKKEVFVALGLRRDLNETKQRFKFKMRKNAVMRKLIIIFLLALSGLTASELCFAAIYSGGNGSGWSYAQATPVMYRGGSGKGGGPGEH